MFFFLVDVVSSREMLAEELSKHGNVSQRIQLKCERGERHWINNGDHIKMKENCF
jgi:hypothetical protein